MDDDDGDDDGRCRFSADEPDSDERDEEEEAEEALILGSPQRLQQDHSRVIVHIDLNAYYYQVEALLDPSLRGKPVGVQQKYLLVTASYEARARGVGKLMSLVEARRRCPELVVVNGEDLTKYRAFSSKVNTVLRRFSPRVERLGLDEAFLDVTAAVAASMHADASSLPPHTAEDGDSRFTGHVYQGRAHHPCLVACGCRRRLALGSRLAEQMRRALKEELGLDSCAGISTNKLLAKLAAGLHKPDAQTTLLPEHAAAFLAPLPARALPGCGWATNQQLQAMGIQTVAQLRLAALPALAERVGAKQAKLLLALARGIDPSPVEVASELAKQMSEEDSFRSCNTRDDAYRRLQTLVAALVERIEERRADHNSVPHTVRLTLRRAAASKQQQQQQPQLQPRRESRQSAIPNPATLFSKPDAADRAAGLFRLAKGLFERMIPLGSSGFNLSLLNICVTSFQPLPSSVTTATTTMTAPASSSSPFFSAKQEKVGDRKQPSPALATAAAAAAAAAGDKSERRLSTHTLASVFDQRGDDAGKKQGQDQRRVSAISVYSLDDDLSGEQEEEEEEEAAGAGGGKRRRRASAISLYSNEEEEGEQEVDKRDSKRRASAISVYSQEEEEGVVVVSENRAQQQGSLVPCAKCGGWLRPCDVDFHAALHLQREEDEVGEAASAAVVGMRSVERVNGVAVDEGGVSGAETPKEQAMEEEEEEEEEEEDDDDDDDGGMEEREARMLVQVTVGMEWAFFASLPPRVRRLVLREARASREQG